MTNVRRTSARPRPVAVPAAVRRTLTFLVQSPATWGAQATVTVARVEVLAERSAVPETVVTDPAVGSIRNTVSPVTAEVTTPRSALATVTV